MPKNAARGDWRHSTIRSKSCSTAEFRDLKSRFPRLSAFKTLFPKLLRKALGMRIGHRSQPFSGPCG